MADANSEKLKVQFEVDLEQLKRQLAGAGVEFDKASKQMATASDKVAVGITNVEKKAGFLQNKLVSLGKAAGIAFTVDLAAKVLGFGGAMDLVSKATDKVAEAIREGAKEIIGLSDKIDKPAENLKLLAERIEQLRGSLGEGAFKLEINRGGTIFGGLPDIKDAQLQLQVLREVEAAQKRIDELSSGNKKISLFGNAPALSRDPGAFLLGDLDALEAAQIARDLQENVNKLTAAYEANQKKLKTARDEHDRWLKSLERGAAAAARERAEAGVTRFANPFANVGATAAQTAIDRSRQVAFDRRSSEIQAAERDDARLESFVRKAIALSRAVADATSGVFEELELARKRADFTAEQSRIFLDDYATTIERTRLQAELTADPFDQLSASLNQIADTAEQRRLNLYEQFVSDGDQEKLREFLDLVDKIEKKQADFVRSSATFGGQTQRRIKEIEQSISDLGGQTVDVAFNSFRGFFRDILSGTASGSEAFRSFAASVVGGLADMLAQWLALRAVGFFFGPGFGAGGAAFGASTAAPAGVRAAGLTSPGGTGSRFGAIGGGAQVTLNLVVQSLDPRTAADVVLGAMPQIQDALTGALAGGSDRRFLEQVRLAR